MSCRKPTHLPPCNLDEEYEKKNTKGITCCYRKKKKKSDKTFEDKKKDEKSSNKKSDSKENVTISGRNESTLTFTACNQKLPSLHDILKYKNDILITARSGNSHEEYNYQSLNNISNLFSEALFFELSTFGEKWLSLSNGIKPMEFKAETSIPGDLDRYNYDIKRAFDAECIKKKSTDFSNENKGINEVNDDEKNVTSTAIDIQDNEKRKEKNDFIFFGRELHLINPEKFNKKKGYYDNINECNLAHSENNRNPVTNQKFLNEPHKFDQLYFHAGDWDDIEKYGLIHIRYKKPKNNKSEIGTAPMSNLYKNYTSTSVVTTLRYCFFHLKKGIFIVIRNNKMVTFLPFSNASYSNTFTKQLFFNDEDKKNQEKYAPAKGINKKMIDDFNSLNNLNTKIEYNRRKWQINNCNIRYFGRGNVEGEHGTNVYKHMIEELCNKYDDIPDCEFIINPRDFPYLGIDKRNRLIEPYEHLYTKEPPLISTKYRHPTYLPILSTCVTSNNADLMLPSSDDWILASKKIYWDYKKNCMKLPKDIRLVPWEKRLSKVIFRGSATGCGVTTETNIRLKAAELAVENSDILDIVLTDINKRPKKYEGNNIQIIDESYLTSKNIQIDKNATLTDEEQFNYKFILYLDGHAAAFRLGRQLKSGSTIIIPKSKYKMWFSDKLVPMKHYVPVKEDLSDLVKQVKWCLANDTKCKRIGENAQILHNELFSKDRLLNEMKFMLKDIALNRSKNNFMDLLKINDKLINDNVVSKNIAIITIFRASGKDKNEREQQKNHFIEIMPNIFDLKKINIEFFIIEQSNDGQKFNIGKLKNVGFDLASQSQKKFEHYIFTDIDVIPDTTLTEYYITFPQNDGPMSLAMKGTRFTKREDKNQIPFFGSSIKFSENQFKKLNGFPNNFWGWGREDHVIATRIKKNKMKLYYPQSGSIIDLEEKSNNVMSTQDKQTLKDHDLKENLCFEKEIHMTDDNGISTLQYKVIDIFENSDKHIKQYIVDLLFDEDKKKYPNWFPQAIKDVKIPNLASIEFVAIQHQKISVSASLQE